MFSCFVIHGECISVFFKGNAHFRIIKESVFKHLYVKRESLKEGRFILKRKKQIRCKMQIFDIDEKKNSVDL